MSDGNGADTNGGSQGSNRATVAVVDAKVDGLRDQIKAEFAAIRETLSLVVGLPVTVAKLEGDVKNLVHRVGELEDDKQESSIWKKATLPVLVLLLAGTIVSIIALVANVH